MIVAAIGDRLRIITQNDHAALAADLLRLWRHRGVADHRLKDEALWAVREHDNGWRESDSSPIASPAGLLDFRAIPDDLRQQIWRRGTRRFADQRPVGAALIAQHSLELHTKYRNRESWSDFFLELDELIRELEEFNDDIGAMRGLYPHLQRVDTLSLALCEDLDLASLPGGYTIEKGNDDESGAKVVGMTPFPFVGATRFRVPMRWIENKRWTSSSELTSTLAKARWKTAEFLLHS